MELEEYPMKLEHANRNAASSIKPPTPEEYAYATTRGLGDTITGDQLREIRAHARAGTRSIVVPTTRSTVGNQTSIETVAERKLKRKIERLENENCKLKVKIMNGK